MTFKKLHYVFSLLTIFFIGLTSEVSAQKSGFATTGSATWYGSKYHGKRTTSGERFNKNEMTAAHNSLPFGTKVKVTNLETQKSVIVRINDRGGFGRYGHIIDLSEAAARKIKVGGATWVKIQVLGANANLVSAEDITETIQPIATSVITNSYPAIQFDSFADKSTADRTKAFKQNLTIIRNEDAINGKKADRVVAGKFTNRSTEPGAKHVNTGS